MEYHPMFTECLNKVHQTLKAERDVKDAVKRRKQYPKDVPDILVRGTQGLLRAELVSLWATLDEWIRHDAPLFEARQATEDGT